MATGVLTSPEETRGLMSNALPPPKVDRLTPTWICFSLLFTVGYFITISTNYLYVFVEQTGRDTEEAEYLYIFYFLSLLIGMAVGFMIESPRMTFRLVLPLAIITAIYWPLNTSYAMLCLIMFINGFIVAAIETPCFVEIKLIWSTVDEKTSDKSEIENKIFYVNAGGVAVGLGTVGPIIVAEISDKSVYAFGYTLATLWLIPYVAYLYLYFYRGDDDVQYILDTDKVILKKAESIASQLSTIPSLEKTEDSSTWNTITTFCTKFQIDIYISLIVCLTFSSWMVISVFMEDSYLETYKISASSTVLGFNLFVWTTFSFRQIIFPSLLMNITDLDVVSTFVFILMGICIVVSLMVLVFDAHNFVDMTVPVMIYTTVYAIAIPPSISFLAISSLIQDNNYKLKKARLQYAESENGGVTSVGVEGEDERTGTFIVLLGIYTGWGGASFVYDLFYDLSANGDGIYFDVSLYIWIPLFNMCISCGLMLIVYIYTVDRDGVKE